MNTKVKEVIEYYSKDIYYFKKSKIVSFQLNKKYKIIIKFVKNYFKDYKNLKALDIGCHLGRYTKALSNLGIKTFGIDTSLPALKIANKNKIGEEYIYECYSFRIQRKIF